MSLHKIKTFPKTEEHVGWKALSPYCEQVPGRGLFEDLTVDFAIVGAGFTGLSVARRLAELHPGADIAVVDALQVGEGASGRNTGYIVDVPIVTNLKGFDVEKAKGLLELNQFAIRRLKSLVEEHELDVDWHQSGKYTSARDPQHHKIIEAYASALQLIGEDVEMLEHSELHQRLGTKFYTKAAYSRGNVTVNPYSLIVGLAQTLPENVQLFVNSPVCAVEKNDSEGTRLVCDEGSLSARKMVFCGNGYNVPMKADASRLMPMYTWACMTRQLSGSELESLQGVTEYAVRSAAPAGATMRFTSDNRILLRNTIKATIHSSPKMDDFAKTRMRKSLEKRFPELAHVPFEYSWGGSICTTLNGQSLFKELSPGVYSIAGMNGAGIAKGTWLGHYMADMISGRQSAELEFVRHHNNPSYIPPEPFRSLGASMTVYWEELKAAEDL